MNETIKTKRGDIPVVIDPSLGPNEFKIVPPIEPVVKVYRGQVPTDAEIKEAISKAIDKLFGR